MNCGILVTGICEISVYPVQKRAAKQPSRSGWLSSLFGCWRVPAQRLGCGSCRIAFLPRRSSGRTARPHTRWSKLRPRPYGRAPVDLFGLRRIAQCARGSFCAQILFHRSSRRKDSTLNAAGSAKVSPRPRVSFDLRVTINQSRARTWLPLYGETRPYDRLGVV